MSSRFPFNGWQNGGFYRLLSKRDHCITQFQGIDWLSDNMAYEPLYHARKIATVKLCFGSFLQSKVSKIKQNVLIVFNKTIIPLAVVGYELIIDNSTLHASLAIYHIISYPKRTCGINVNCSSPLNFLQTLVI